MASCQDCIEVKAGLSGNPCYEIIDIGEHVRNLKEFIRLRDSSPAFDAIKANGTHHQQPVCRYHQGKRVHRNTLLCDG